MNNISVKDKKKFLKWAVDNLTFRTREAFWLFDYIKTNNKVLGKIVFTDDLKEKSNVLVASTVCSDNQVSLFFHNGETHLDYAVLDEVFRYLQKSDDILYVSINFKNKFQNSLYVAVHESQTEEILSPEVVSEADDIIKASQYQMLLKDIDVALDQNNMDKFMKTWEMIEELREEKIGR